MCLFWFLLVFTIILSTIGPCLSQSRIRQSFGATCNKALKCEGNAWLKCDEGICNCTYPDEMKWDTQKSRCVALAGEKCIYESRGDNGNLVAKINCIENSTCNSLGFCECSSRYYASIDGICTLKKTYGISCMKNEECNSDVSLQCTNGICRCNTTVAAYSEIYNQCVGLSTESAIESKCVPNAYSNYGNYYKNGHSLYYHRCSCSSGFVTSIKKFCVKQYSEICSTTMMCDEDSKIICKSKSGEIPIKLTCQCRDSKHQYYNVTSNMCSSLIHGVCESRNECTENAICIDNEGSGVLRCECDKGYVENAEGKCDLEYGSECLTSSTSIVQCDRHANLVCKKNICSCGDENLIFDTKQRQCVGLPGSRCGKGDKCIENSECVQIYSDLQGTCECLEGFKNTGDKCTIDDEKNFVDIGPSTTTTTTDNNLIEETTLASDENEALIE